MRWDESSLWLNRLGERILLSLCRDPSAPDYAGGTVKTTVDNSLDFLSLTVPDFRSRFVGKKVLDFGCGWGNQVVPLDVDPHHFSRAVLGHGDRLGAAPSRETCVLRARQIRRFPEA